MYISKVEYDCCAVVQRTSKPCTNRSKYYIEGLTYCGVHSRVNTGTISQDPSETLQNAIRLQKCYVKEKRINQKAIKSKTVKRRNRLDKPLGDVVISRYVSTNLIPHIEGYLTVFLSCKKYSECWGKNTQTLLTNTPILYKDYVEYMFTNVEYRYLRRLLVNGSNLNLITERVDSCDPTHKELDYIYSNQEEMMSEYCLIAMLLAR